MASDMANLPASLHVVPPYAGALALVFVVLAGRVIFGRRGSKMALGAPPNTDLERRVRVHANFAEYVPFALLLLAMAELRHVPAVILHVLCACLLLARLSHAWGYRGRRRITGSAWPGSRRR